MKTKYIELPLFVFCNLHPEYFQTDSMKQLVRDPLYIVRFLPDLTFIEVGYRSDVWLAE